MAAIGQMTPQIAAGAIPPLAVKSSKATSNLPPCRAQGCEWESLQSPQFLKKLALVNTKLASAQARAENPNVTGWTLGPKAMWEFHIFGRRAVPCLQVEAPLWRHCTKVPTGSFCDPAANGLGA